MRLRQFGIATLAAACALGATAAGCTTSSPNGKKTDKPYTVECDEDAPTGSHISRLRCYRRPDREERTRRDRETMEKIQYNTARPQKADGTAPSRPLVLQSSSGGAVISPRGSGQVK
jgi:hypothetical protein